ncbi:diacylglycerol/lipid kinase family protein [Paucilactobacillus sp. N302-9]
MEFLIILNKHAGSGTAAKVWQQIEPELNRRQVDYQLKISQYPGHTTYLAKQYAIHATNPSQAVLLVIGGDGTLHQALNGALQANLSVKLPLAYIPAGSGNDFARGLKMKTNPLAALNQILNCQKPIDIHIGQYRENIKNESGYFVNNIGVGFDAAVVSQTNSSTSKKRLNKYHLGSLSYLSSVIGVLYHQSNFELNVETDSAHDIYRQAFLVTTSNHPYFGGGVAILPSASVFDDNLELAVFEKKNWLVLVWVAILLMFGKHLNSRFFHHYKSPHIRVTTTSLEYGQIDGEVMGNRFFDLQMNVSQYPFWIDLNA